MTGVAHNSPAHAVAVVLTCEHGGNLVPEPYAGLFQNAETVLNSHRGWDPGALQLAQLFGAELDTPVYSSIVSRLVVELNRSLDSPQLFSEFTDELDLESKSKLLNQHWYPYRTTVEKDIRRLVDGGQLVVHLSVHSFTPIWNGAVRDTDVGLLFDPARLREANFCHHWKTALNAVVPELTVNPNSPYSGTDDGFVTALRDQFSENRYIGLELEVNQKFLMPTQPQTMRRVTWETVEEELAIVAGLARVQSNVGETPSLATPDTAQIHCPRPLAKAIITSFQHAIAKL